MFTTLVGLVPSTETYVATTTPLEAHIMPVVATSTPEWIKGRIKYYAEIYGVSEEIMNAVIKCESQYNPNAWGDGGYSRGLVQIHYPSHPTISDEQATDVNFSLEFLAKNLKDGKGNMWTCYRNLPEKSG